MEELPPLVQPEDDKIKREDVRQEAAQIAAEIQTAPAPPEYRYPPVDLLRRSTGAAADGTQEMRQNAERLADTLQSFNIEANIVNVTRGPSVTRYELELSRGTKLSKVTNLADDIALALGASGVRIAAIPDKISVVGIEVPNKLVTTVLALSLIHILPSTRRLIPCKLPLQPPVKTTRLIFRPSSSTWMLLEQVPLVR